MTDYFLMGGVMMKSLNVLLLMGLVVSLVASDSALAEPISLMGAGYTENFDGIFNTGSTGEGIGHVF